MFFERECEKKSCGTYVNNDCTNGYIEFKAQN